MQKPTIGRQVHFVLENGEHRPATIVKVWSDECVNLRVLFDGTNDPASETLNDWRTSVIQEIADMPSKVHHWHWPERVE